MSSRKTHRREYSFRRAESFIQHRLRRPGRSERTERQFEIRRARRGVWKLLRQWLAEMVEVPA